MSIIIDRRLNDRRKHVANRERFMRRYRRHVRRAVTDVVDERSISDAIGGADVTIPRRDIKEPVWRHGKDGSRDIVLPGNREFMPGDQLQRPEKGDGEGGEVDGEGGNGDGTDAFTFTLTRDEFLAIFFDDLELPNLMRTETGDILEPRSERAGYASDGAQTNLAVLRTMRQALARRIALGAPLRRRLAELDEKADSDDVNADLDEQDRERQELERRLKALPWLDEVDLRYRRRVQVPRASSQAVMFCLMDVSASMDEHRKGLAKRFYTLLYLFLSRQYAKVELVFVRHTDRAEEVDEDRFFHDRQTGGTTVLPALKLASKLIEERYPSTAWNVYCAQASDGDAFGVDPERSRQWLVKALLPTVRYFAYIEVGEIGARRASALSRSYSSIDAEHFQMAKVRHRRSIYPVFRRLFEKRERSAGMDS